MSAQGSFASNVLLVWFSVDEGHAQDERRHFEGMILALKCNHDGKPSP